MGRSFPLAPLADGARVLGPRAAERRALVEQWNRALRSGQLADRFFWPLRPGESDARAMAGDALYRLAFDDCAAGGGVRPRRGSALLFENRVGGLETIEAVHASCGLAADAPPKHALVKLACDGSVSRR